MNTYRIVKTLALSGILLFSLIAGSQTVEDEPQIMKQLHGSKIERQVYNGYTTYKVYDAAKLKWGLHGVVDMNEGDKGMEFELESFIPPVCDEIFWDDQLPVVIARLGKKIALITSFNEGMKAVKPEFVFDDYRTSKKGEQLFLLVKQNDLWGLFDYRSVDSEPLLVFASEKDVPLRYMENEEAEQFQKAFSLTKADKLEFDKINGEVVFRARNKTSKKWGLYQLLSGSELLELIPAEYDSLEFMPADAPFCIVYQHGKTGVFLSKWQYPEAKQSVACEYDVWKTVKHADGKIYLALAEGDLWGWVDWLNGDEKSDFTAPSFAALPKPEYVQSYDDE